MTADVPRYFVSYARTDGDFALQLAKDLRAAGANVWVDQLDIVGGERWDQAVESAMPACQGMIVILSPHAVASNNVMDEVNWALENGKRVVPVLHAACEVPFRLRRIQRVDFTESYETGLAALRRALDMRAAPAPAEPAPIATAPEHPEPVAAKRPAEPQAQPASSAPRRKSYLLALLLHVVGLGMFYAAPRKRRRWLYLLATASIPVVLFLANQPSGPFTRCSYYPSGQTFCYTDQNAVAVALYPPVGIIALGVLDVLVACRRSRRRRQMAVAGC